LSVEESPHPAMALHAANVNSADVNRLPGRAANFMVTPSMQKLVQKAFGRKVDQFAMNWSAGTRILVD
jgi:hypothetical protein